MGCRPTSKAKKVSTSKTIIIEFGDGLVDSTFIPKKLIFIFSFFGIIIFSA